MPFDPRAVPCGYWSERAEEWADDRYLGRDQARVRAAERDAELLYVALEAERSRLRALEGL